METLKQLIFLTLFLAIGLVGKASTEDGNQVCYLGDNITNSKLLDLQSKNIRKPTLDFWVYYLGLVGNPKIGFLLSVLRLIAKGFELLENSFDPHPVIVPILPQFLPKPAPAAYIVTQFQD